MKLSVDIHSIKAIRDFHIEFPTDSGLYAVTGQNAAGKSTIVACASTVFFNMQMNDYFGRNIEKGGYISFELNGATRKWYFDKGWHKEIDNGRMRIKGYYEGSIIFGNRFRDTNYAALKKVDRIDQGKLEVGSEFIRENLGYILHNNKNYYDKLFKVQKETSLNEYGFKGDVYIYERADKRVSQLYMSTGENLLVSILHSLSLRIENRSDLDTPCMLFLDEIELALHPSSLSRLVVFLRKLASEFNLAVYFSTHSIELIRDIEPDNIFFIERHADNSLEVINPCYPSYATRILYDHSGYDYIILVEDDLAKEIVSRLLRKYKLINNKLVHVLPCGGWNNVIKLADEVINSNLVSKPSSFLIILDGDVEEQVAKFLTDNKIKFNVPINYLPIESLEKYLKMVLHDQVNHSTFRNLNDYLFHKVSLTEIVEKYRQSPKHNTDKSGKEFYKMLEAELKARNKTRHELVEMVVEDIESNQISKLTKLKLFLEEKLS